MSDIDVPAAPRDGSYDSPRSVTASISAKPGPSPTPRHNPQLPKPPHQPPRQRSAEEHDPSSGAYPADEAGPGAFSEDFIESLGAGSTAQKSPTTALGWSVPWENGEGGSSRKGVFTGGAGYSGGGGRGGRGGGVEGGGGWERRGFEPDMAYPVTTEVNLFEHMTAGRPTDDSFARHAVRRITTDDRDWRLSKGAPPSGHPTAVGGHRAGSAFSPIVVAHEVGDDDSNPTRQHEFRTEHCDVPQTWHERSRSVGQAPWASAPFEPDMGTVGRNPGYSRSCDYRQPVRIPRIGWLQSE